MSDFINKVELVGLVVTPPGIIDAPEPYGCISVTIPNEGYETNRQLRVPIMGQAVAVAKSLEGGEKVRLLGKVDYSREFEDAHIMRPSVTFDKLEILDKD
jgi:hypothetical protein